MIPRTLYANEIECRIGTKTSKGVSLLLYKDARVDMRLLDELYTPMGWKRSHAVIDGNLYCTIEIWDDSKKEWIAKQDVGKESFTEKEKGQASDSFKRAGFNWGIGRELYTAPFIWVNTTDDELDSKGNVKTRFIVKEIDYNDNREINHLVIVDSKGNPRYTYGKKAKAETPEPTLAEAIAEMYTTTSTSEVKECWNKYPQYKKNEQFKAACAEQGNKFK